MRVRWNNSGFTLVEVLVALAVLVVGLMALLGLLSAGSLSVAVGGGQSKATAYARQMVEQLRNQPLCLPAAPLPPNPPPCFPTNGADVPELGITRTWTITPEGLTVAPNRLWRINVAVAVRQSGSVGTQNITAQTMRAE